ncbi:MAG: glutathione S-transferase family protein [Chromatiales bacterium]|nr:glutathione S-transferase family protein [Chromatiales bacterium]
MNHLIIGNKNYSSWSLRPWLLLKEKKIPFEETKVPLYVEGSEEAILEHSPSGKVPAFVREGITVWDSLAICEYISELYPEKLCWPEDIESRALARSVSHEMHSGFFAIRNDLHMNCRKKMVFTKITSDLKTDIERICEIWKQCREQHADAGDYLFGSFSIADAMYAPIVLRFNSYGTSVGETERAYMDTILSNPSVKEWIAEGIEEKEFIEECEVVE